MDNQDKVLQSERTLCVTTDYSIFKALDGNRDVLESRKQKIIKSINSVGYICSPIIVNEHFEVIDGQGRLAALKELGLPVEFIIHPGLTIEHCVAMNIYQTNWSINDYISSYAKKGNQNYIRLELLREKYSKLKLNVIVCASTHVWGMHSTNSLKNGTFLLTESEYRDAIDTLSFLDEVRPFVDKIKGRTDCFYAAIVFAITETSADRNRIRQRIEEGYDSITPIATMQSALASLERIYNYRIRPTNKLYLATEYDMYQCKNVKSYKARWGTKAK